MYIALYISSHGFGHMTRCLGIMENILKTSDYNLYIVCNKKQNDFARIYLAEYKDRIIKEVDIENLIEVVIERYQKIQRNKLKKMHLSSWKEELVIAIFTSELENNLYEYLKVPKAKIRKRKIEVDN